MQGETTVLMIDDNEDDFVMTSESMSDAAGTRFHFDWAATFEDGLNELASNSHDVCLVDYTLGARNGLALVQEALKAGTTVPMILLTGMNDHDLDIEATRAGASDYLVKNEVSPPILERSIRYVLAHQAHLLEMRHYATQLQKSNAQLKSLYDTANKFVNNASHEIRTPLTVIREFTSILVDGLGGELNKTQKEYLNIVIDRVDDLRLMVDDMLDISRIEAGLFGVCRREQFIGDIIAALEPAIQRKAVTAGATLEIDIEEALPAVFCDAENIRRVILNLVVNACKFAGEDCVVRLWARRDPEASAIMIGVTDNGPGIAEDCLQEIFARFHQLGGNVKATSKGFGLGLSIVKELVHINLGEIKVESTLGEGSTFSFSVPEFDIAVIIDRFVHKVANAEDPSPVLSLIEVRAAPDVADDNLNTAELFLQRQMRRCELLLPTGRGRWAICAAAGGKSVRKLVNRFRTGLGNFNLNNPGRKLGDFKYDIVDTWPVDQAASEITTLLQSHIDERAPAPAPEAQQPAAAAADGSV